MSPSARTSCIVNKSSYVVNYRTYITFLVRQHLHEILLYKFPVYAIGTKCETVAFQVRHLIYLNLKVRLYAECPCYDIGL